MKYIGTYSNDADIATKAKVDAKQDKVLANGILQGDGTGTISAAETQEVELVELTKADVGLDNVDNTSDANKPISTATQAALNGKQAIITGGASTITSSNLTGNRALVSDVSGKVAVSAVTSTELGYLDGVTSNIQTQLNGKLSTAPVTSVNSKTGVVELSASDVGALPTSGGTMTGELWFDVNANRYVIIGDSTDASLNIVGAVTGTSVKLGVGNVRPIIIKADVLSGDVTTTITDVVTPTADTDAANKAYVDTQDATKQPKITANGFLKGDGSGGITAEKPVFTVTITPTEADSSIGTADKTPEEILAAYNAGYAVQAVYDDSLTLQLSSIGVDIDAISIIFSTSMYLDGQAIGYGIAHTDSSGSWHIYQTEMVPETRTINGKGLFTNITLNAADVNAVGLTGDQTIAGGKTFTGATTFAGAVNFSSTEESPTFALGATFGGGIEVNGGSNFTGQQAFNNGMVVSDQTFYKENSTVDFTNATVTGLKGILPTVTTSNNGQFLRVVNGAWAAATVENANGVSF